MDTNNRYVLKNKKLPDEVETYVNNMFSEGETPLFVIIGDMKISGKYAETAAIFTKDAVIIFDGEPGKQERFLFSDMKNVESKRMYGNATLSAIFPDGKRKIFFRYTYSVAVLCDAAALFINHINEEKDLNEETAVMAVTFEKALSVCPKCGRALLHPGAECIMCRSKVKVFGQFIKYIAPFKWPIVGCILLSIFTTFLSLVPPTITGFIVDDVFSKEAATTAIAPLKWLADMMAGEPTKLLMTMIILLLCTYVIQYSIGMIRAYNFRIIGEKAVALLRNDIYRKAQHLPMKFYDKTSTGSMVNRIAMDSSNIRNFMLRLTQEAVVYLFQIVGIVCIMMSLNWQLTLLSLIPVVFIVVVSRIFSKKIKPYYRRSWRRWTSVLSYLSDTIPCVKVVKSFTGEHRTADIFVQKNKEFIAMDMKIGKIATAFPQVISFLVTCGSLFIWGFGGSNVIAEVDGYSPGLIVSFISYASMFYTPVTFFANLSDTYQSTLASTEKILDILEAEPEAQAEAHIVPDKLKGKIEFLHVGFSFDRTKKVLDDVTITIEPGEVVGIVGTTGSGKSTLINLLMRFYDGYSGEILVDGHNIKNLDLAAFRGQIGYVQQDPMMFSDTIYNNIAYSNPNATVEDVIHAADVANAHGFIARQPDAYDTVLGERGVGVSGGEKQRISIARAVLKEPSILIFDEATAAVDSETEHLIQEAIDRLIVGKTTLMIAHRLSTLKRANRIIVVDGGKIVENGSPEELMALKGKYYKLVQIQSMSQDAERMREEERF